MTKDHVYYFKEVLGLTPDRIEKILKHLIETKQAWCFVDGQIIDRGFCEKYLEANKEGL